MTVFSEIPPNSHHSLVSYITAVADLTSLRKSRSVIWSPCSLKRMHHSFQQRILQLGCGARMVLRNRRMERYKKVYSPLLFELVFIRCVRKYMLLWLQMGPMYHPELMTLILVRNIGDMTGRRKTCPSNIQSSTYPTWTRLPLNQDLRGVKPELWGAQVLRHAVYVLTMPRTLYISCLFCCTLTSHSRFRHGSISGQVWRQQWDSC